jgi:hypothetical protein
MHLLPTDELRRQYEAGEITREYYEAMRKTEPDWRDGGLSDAALHTAGVRRA